MRVKEKVGENQMVWRKKQEGKKQDVYPQGQFLKDEQKWKERMLLMDKTAR